MGVIASSVLVFQNGVSIMGRDVASACGKVKLLCDFKFRPHHRKNMKLPSKRRSIVLGCG
ncbi:hypothetical protein X727_12555 [Mesorhizobium sp. L103C119B0]|nr:hypothetical protein X727_12555 [Mesorhizobium sp. L103C119B0]